MAENKVAPVFLDTVYNSCKQFQSNSLNWMFGDSSLSEWLNLRQERYDN